MHAYVHRETCIQCGLCPGVCPEVFSILPGESAQAITEPVPQPTFPSSWKSGPSEAKVPSTAENFSIFPRFFGIYSLHPEDFMVFYQSTLRCVWTCPCS